MKYYTPKISIIKDINRNVDPNMLCNCGCSYRDHFEDNLYCDFEPITFVDDFYDKFYEYLYNKKCFESIDYIFQWRVNKHDRTIQKVLCRILDPEYYPTDFTEEDLEFKINIKDLRSFVETLVIKEPKKSITGKFRRHKIMRNKYEKS